MTSSEQPAQGWAHPGQPSNGSIPVWQELLFATIVLYLAATIVLAAIFVVIDFRFHNHGNWTTFWLSGWYPPIQQMISVAFVAYGGLMLLALRGWHRLLVGVPYIAAGVAYFLVDSSRSSVGILPFIPAAVVVASADRPGMDAARRLAAQTWRDLVALRLGQGA